MNMKSFMNQSKYDYYVIDEAHKKNINIELIISLFKIFLLFNKNIKFFILSATIDQD